MSGKSGINKYSCSFYLKLSHKLNFMNIVRKIISLTYFALIMHLFCPPCDGEDKKNEKKEYIRGGPKTLKTRKTGPAPLK